MTTQTNNQTENQTENQNVKSVLENLHTSIANLDLSKEEGIIFIAVEPSGKEQTKLIASIQGNPTLLAAAIYKAMSADEDFAHLIRMAMLRNIIGSEEENEENEENEN